MLQQNGAGFNTGIGSISGSGKDILRIISSPSGFDPTLSPITSKRF